MKGKGRTCLTIHGDMDFLKIHGDMDFLRLGKVYSIAIDDIQTVTICGCMPSTDCMLLPRNSWFFSAAYRSNHNHLPGLFGPARGKSTAVSEIGIHSDLWRISTLSHKSRWGPRWFNRWPNFIPKRWRSPLQPLSSGYLFAIPKKVTSRIAR